MEILEMKSTMYETKDSLDGFNSRIEMEEEKPNNLKIEQEESSNLENTEGKEIKFVKMSRMSAICETISKN